MGEQNQTILAEFIFLGLSRDLQTQILLFILFLIIYLLTVLGNLLIIILTFMDSRLHTPMYLFLRNLSFADLCFSTSIVPQVLVHFLVTRKIISFGGCVAQIFVFLLVGCTECALLAVMSYVLCPMSYDPNPQNPEQNKTITVLRHYVWEGLWWGNGQLKRWENHAPVYSFKIDATGPFSHYQRKAVCLKLLSHSVEGEGE